MHDEAFKKLLQTFFAEFLELFFPEWSELIDHRHTRFLMQELLVDTVGKRSKRLDLLVETRFRGVEIYILIHLEPQSYWERDFAERMFVYFGRIFEKYRRRHKMIVPIAILAYDEPRDTPDQLTMEIAGHTIFRFQFLKVELRKQNWRRFIDSDNPVAAALLSKMGYTQVERRQVRSAFLRMILRLRRKWDDASIALIMSVAELYFEPKPEEDEEIMAEIRKEFPVEGAEMTELMPAWKRWGFEEGVAKGIEQGIEKGIDLGKQSVAQKLLSRGFSIEEVAETVELSVEAVKKLAGGERTS